MSISLQNLMIILRRLYLLLLRFLIKYINLCLHLKRSLQRDNLPRNQNKSKIHSQELKQLMNQILVLRVQMKQAQRIITLIITSSLCKITKYCYNGTVIYHMYFMYLIIGKIIHSIMIMSLCAMYKLTKITSAKNKLSFELVVCR